MFLQISKGDFVVAKKRIGEIPQNAVGLVNDISGDMATVFFIGKSVDMKTVKDNIIFVDIEKTGKGYKFKICNICHILKKEGVDFDKNQTDAKGKATTRPSCRSCRILIDGVKLTAEEKTKMDKIRPKKKTLFTCPICEKRTIVGITANLVRDHNHKTGTARAWICDSCNTGLGRFKDDIKLFNRIIDYLKKFPS